MNITSLSSLGPFLNTKASASCPLTVMTAATLKDWNDQSLYTPVLPGLSNVATNFIKTCKLLEPDLNSDPALNRVLPTYIIGGLVTRVSNPEIPQVDIVCMATRPCLAPDDADIILTVARCACSLQVPVRCHMLEWKQVPRDCACST